MRTSGCLRHTSPMDAQDLAVRLRSVPAMVAELVVDLPDRRLRTRPAPGEWSAIEVMGHLIDKFDHWCRRTTLVAAQDNPVLQPYDQDECVRVADYQSADLTGVLGGLVASAERFARTVVSLPAEAFDRYGVHGEYGSITLSDCITLPLDSVPDHLRQIQEALTFTVG